MVKDQRKIFFLIHAAVDVVLLLMAMAVSVVVAMKLDGGHISGVFPVEGIHRTQTVLFPYFFTFAGFIALPFITAWATRHYRTDIFIRTHQLTSKIFFIHVLYFLVFNFLMLFFSPPGGYRLYGNIVLVATGNAYVCHRYLWDFFIKRTSGHSNFVCHVLIAGDAQQVSGIAGRIQAFPEWGIRIAGCLLQAHSEKNYDIGDVPVLGIVNELPGVLNAHIIDSVILTDNGIGVFDDQFVKLRCDIEGVGHISSEDFFRNGAEAPDRIFLQDKSGRMVVKRIIDILVSAGWMILLLPLWGVIPILIKADSKGPVFFRQTRVGRNGRLFTMYKFRSMVPNAEEIKPDLIHLNEMDGPAFKIKEDPRQTRVGTLLRKSSLDELPQLFNVLRGDISLVGPRPPVQEEVDQYRPWEKKRLSVMQGISCLWQISGRNEIKFDEWMKLDLMYIEHQSLQLDFVIMLKTLPAVFSRKGAR